MPTSVRAAHAAELRELGPGAVREYLSSRSGLPGPRANLELMQAFADVAAPALIHELSRDDDVYLRCCGTVGLGRLYLEGDDDEGAAVRDRLTGLAGDESWRVREATAMAAQRIGEGDPAAVRTMVSQAGLASTENWAFGDTFAERLRYEVDPKWQGDIPRTILMSKDGTTTTIEGSANISSLENWAASERKK